MASPAVAGVASPVDARVASLVDLVGGVTVGVTPLADAGVASMADAGVASLADLAGSVAGDPVGVVTDGVAFLEGCVVRSDSVFVSVDVCDNGLDCFVCDEPGGVDNCPDMTFFIESVNVIFPVL